MEQDTVRSVEQRNKHTSPADVHKDGEKKKNLKPEFADDYIVYLVLLPVTGFLLMMGCTQNVCLPWELDIPRDLASYLNITDTAVVFAFYGLQIFLSSLPVGKLYRISSRIGILEYRCGAWFNAVITMSIIVLLHIWGYKVTVFPDKSISYMTASAIFGLFMSCLMYYKGKTNPVYPNPSITGNQVYDFFMGLEISPRLGNYDVKSSSHGMCTVSCLVHNILLVVRASEEDSLSPTLFVVCLLQIVIAVDFLTWQNNFFTTFEIDKESSGYQLIMGYYVWAFLYTSITRYIFYSRVETSPPILFITVALFTVGYRIYHQSNTQKHIFRMDPNNPLVACLQKIKTSTQKDILCDGWWGWVRHPNYFGEIIINWSYVIPCGFTHWVPFIDPIIVTYLIKCRAKRDNRRCWEQYGEAWTIYRNKVKYYIIPYVF